MRGVSKDDMGYSEGVWDLTLWEQIILARQNIYDGTWVSGDHIAHINVAFFRTINDIVILVSRIRSLTAPLLCWLSTAGEDPEPGLDAGFARRRWLPGYE